MAVTPEQEAKIAELRFEKHETRRATVPELEKILQKEFRVLDRGFIKIVDYMGDDAAIVQAARVSYGEGTKKVREDRGLIRYLMRHHHTTPFEMCEIKFHVKLPIFVARQWIRHRTANVNEYSARYSVLEKEFYVPGREHVKAQKAQAKLSKQQRELFSTLMKEPTDVEVAAQSETNKQGRAGQLSESEIQEAVDLISSESKRAYSNYVKLLNEEAGRIRDPNKTGIARELARMVLPTNFYTRWYWKTDLHNLMHFLKLRAHPHAQYEIRAYANVMLEILSRWVPLTYEAFIEYQKDGAFLSSNALKVLRQLLDGEKVAEANSGLSGREWRELMAVLGRAETGDE